MNRREFSAAAAAATVVGMSSANASAKETDQQYIELRHYQSLYGSKKGMLDKFMREAAIPALNRLGIGPVGAFSVKYGTSSPSLYLLLPHATCESALNVNRNLLDDKQFLKDGAEFLNASLSDPAFMRMESRLMKAFSHMPKVEVPEAVKGVKSRIFEMRTYESHSEIKSKKKIEMFNEGGEIAVFRKTGLHPVFFGESLYGPKLPNLVYMLSFEDMATRDKNWKQFVTSPEWKELSGKQEYKETVSNISDVILRPKGYSQIQVCWVGAPFMGALNIYA